MVANALHFLKTHQPLPQQLTSHLQAHLHQALVAFQMNPILPEVVVPLLLNCWNDWEEGIHQEAIIQTLKKYPPEMIRPHIAFGLKSAEFGKRLWFAEAARFFPYHGYKDDLLVMLKANHPLERFVAACALELLNDREVQNEAARQLTKETDQDTIEVLESMLNPAVS